MNTPKNQLEIATGQSGDKPATPDCPYCGQVGGVSQYDSICQEHGPAEGYVVDGKFVPACPPVGDLKK